VKRLKGKNIGGVKLKISGQSSKEGIKFLGEKSYVAAKIN